MAERVQLRRKNTYRTRGNVVKKFRTPGGKLTVQYKNKRVKRAVCSSTGERLNGIKRLAVKYLTKKQRTVSRPYGGVLAGSEVRNRIKRALLNEEMRVLKTAVHAKKARTGKKAKK